MAEQVVEGFLVVWTHPFMQTGHIRDVFFQSAEQANRVAQDCIDHGYRVWIERRHCVDGRLNIIKSDPMSTMNSEDLTWCTWCDRPRRDCVCHLDPAGLPAGHWSLTSADRPTKPTDKPRPKFVAIRLAVMCGDRYIATATSHTMAKRIARALNLHSPDERGV